MWLDRDGHMASLVVCLYVNVVMVMFMDMVIIASLHVWLYV